MYETSNFENVCPLTPEQAKIVDLPVLNLFARIHKIREYAADMRLDTVIIGGLGFYNGENPITRRGLIARAERHQESIPSWDTIINALTGRASIDNERL